MIKHFSEIYIWENSTQPQQEFLFSLHFSLLFGMVFVLLVYNQLNVFNMKVYNYVSHWHNGVAFEGDVYAKAFKSLDDARRMFDADKQQAIYMIEKEYDGYYEDSKESELYTIIGDSDEFQNDWWEGKIIIQEI